MNSDLRKALTAALYCLIFLYKVDRIRRGIGKTPSNEEFDTAWKSFQQNLTAMKSTGPKIRQTIFKARQPFPNPTVVYNGHSENTAWEVVEWLSIKLDKALQSNNPPVRSILKTKELSKLWGELIREVALVKVEEGLKPVDDAKWSKPDPIEDILADILTKQQQAIVNYLWTKSRGASFDVLLDIPGAWRDCPSDDAVKKALDRIANRFNTHSELGITLEISTGKRRAKLIRPPDKLRDK